MATMLEIIQSHFATECTASAFQADVSQVFFSHLMIDETIF
jgi:hypothetical protein